MNTLGKELGLRIGESLAFKREDQTVLLERLQEQLTHLKTEGLLDEAGSKQGITLELALKVHNLGGNKLPGSYTLTQLRQSPEWAMIASRLDSMEKLSVHGVLGRVTSSNREFYQYRTRLSFKSFSMNSVPVEAPPDKTLDDLRAMNVEQLLSLQGVKLPSAIFLFLAFN